MGKRTENEERSLCCTRCGTEIAEGEHLFTLDDLVLCSPCFSGAQTDLYGISYAIHGEEF